MLYVSSYELLCGNLHFLRREHGDATDSLAVIDFAKVAKCLFEAMIKNALFGVPKKGKA